MKNFLKSFSFLLLMAVLGGLSLILPDYLWGTIFYDVNGSVLLLLPYIFNLLLIGALVIGIFYKFRHWLFGRGIPWLAGISIFSWLAVWGLMITLNISGSNHISTTPMFILGQDRLRDHLMKMVTTDELNVALKSSEKFNALCKNFAESPSVKTGEVQVKRDGFALNARVEFDVFKAYIESKPCDQKLLKKELNMLMVSGLLAVAEGEKLNAALNFERAADLGNSVAQETIGRLYLSGFGVAQGNEKGLQWLEKSAAQNNDGAQTALGTIYWDGKYGVLKNESRAIALLKKAAAQGNADAKKNLKFIGK